MIRSPSRKEFIEFLHFVVAGARGSKVFAERGQRFGHAAFRIAPAAEDFLGEFVGTEPLAENEAGFAHDQFEQIELVLQHGQ